MYKIAEYFDMARIKFFLIGAYIRHTAFWAVLGALIVFTSVLVDSYASTVVGFFAGGFLFFIVYRTISEIHIGGEHRHVRIRWFLGLAGYIAGGMLGALIRFALDCDFTPIDGLFRHYLGAFIVFIALPFLVVMLKGEYQDVHYHFPTLFSR